MRLVVEALACGLLLPGLLAVGGLLQAEVCGERGRTRWAWLLGNLTIAVAFWAGFAALRFAPLWPQLPLWHWHWIAYWGLLAAGVGLVTGVTTAPRLWLRRPADVALALALATMVLLTWARLEPVRVGWFLVVAVAIPVVSWSLEAQCRRWPGARIPFFIGLTVAVAGGVIGGVWGSAKFAQEFGVLGATILAWWIVRLRRPSQEPSHGATLTIAVLLVLLLIESDLFTTYDELGHLPRLPVLLILAAPSAAWLGAVPAVARRGERWTIVCQVAATVGVLALAAFLA